MTDPDEGELRVWLERVPPQSAAGGGALATCPAIQSCRHLTTEKRNGKTHCARCKRQLCL